MALRLKDTTNTDTEKRNEKWQHKQIKNLRIWKEITKLSETKERTHAPSELTSVLRRHVKHATVQKAVPQKAAGKVRGTKTRQSALSKRIRAAASSAGLFLELFPVRHRPTSSIRNDKRDMTALLRQETTARPRRERRATCFNLLISLFPEKRSNEGNSGN